ncbi:hypothetical protein [Alteraurantiacibacter buctensis]|uniref:Uncharacterized protein n=1 Tax=Alteraurantiacibacter buctensis TaxID=1503981 RepID=A0A844Z1V5_9SPHN|nr:hypothetical protein [Alteraurantiacibacter buctensis]MXO73492.1 hypothetical protein [Alteraurantiacibacter buctensis]
MRRHLEKPETWILIHGFFLAFLWEILQMPFFYSTENLSAWEIIKNCLFATLGDAGIMVFAYWTTAKLSANALWLRRWHVRAILIYLGIGLTVTIAIEYFAATTDWGWKYSSSMPTFATIGLVPIVMWIIVPILTLTLARQSLLGSKGSTGD